MYFVPRDLCLYMNLNPVIHLLRSQGSLPLHEFKLVIHVLRSQDLCLYMNLNLVIHVLRSQGSLPLHEFKSCNTCTSFPGISAST